MEEKRVSVIINPPTNYVGKRENMPNVGTFFYEGKRYDIPYNKASKVPLGLAENLKRQNYIDFFEDID